MKILAVTQARIGSTRLPEKILLKVKNKSLLEIHLERILKSKNINFGAGIAIELMNYEFGTLCLRTFWRNSTGVQEPVLRAGKLPVGIAGR